MSKKCSWYAPGLDMRWGLSRCEATAPTTAAPSKCLGISWLCIPDLRKTQVIFLRCHESTILKQPRFQRVMLYDKKTCFFFVCVKPFWEHDDGNLGRFISAATTALCHSTVSRFFSLLHTSVWEITFFKVIFAVCTYRALSCDCCTSRNLWINMQKLFPFAAWQNMP